MAVDKLVDSTQLNADLTSIANAIRTKGGTSAQLAFPSGFVSAIADIPSGGGSGGVIIEDTTDAAGGTVRTITGVAISGTKTITQNGTGIDVTEYELVDVAVPSGSSKALYTYLGLASLTANSYGATNAKVTVAKAGTYNISYVAIRGSSSGTMGTNLYIGETGKGNNTTWNNGTYGQYVTYSNQSISANTDVTIYATSGNTSRTIYVGQLIVEEV